MEYKAIVVGKNQRGKEKIIEKTINKATAERIMHDAIRAVYGWDDKGTIKCMESSISDFKIKHKNGNKMTIKKA